MKDIVLEMAEVTDEFAHECTDCYFNNTEDEIGTMPYGCQPCGIIETEDEVSIIFMEVKA